MKTKTNKSCVTCEHYGRLEYHVGIGIVNQPCKACFIAHIKTGSAWTQWGKQK